ncbi:MAG: hypothetical protein ACOX6T_06280 [Myxococcales bacterium]|jgi:hypothetical protein
MSECPKLAACPFFGDRMKGMDGMANLFKKRYCTGEFERCARWKVAKAGLGVPADLFPNQIERVDQILEAASSRTAGAQRAGPPGRRPSDRPAEGRSGRSSCRLRAPPLRLEARGRRAGVSPAATGLAALKLRPPFLAAAVSSVITLHSEIERHMRRVPPAPDPAKLRLAGGCLAAA